MKDCFGSQLKIGDKVWHPRGAKLMTGIIIMTNVNGYVCIRADYKPNAILKSTQTLKVEL